VEQLGGGLNRAYDIAEGRPWWKVRLVAIALTVGLAPFIISAMTLVMIGPTLAEHLASRLGLGPAFEWAWKILQWPVVFVLVTAALAVLNYVAPDAEQDWEWVTPGAVLSTVLWLIASLVFTLYLVNFADYNVTYGSLGSVIVLLLWFYLSALAALIGSEMNAEIEHASPYGKDPGEKVPGKRKKLGAAATRAYAARQRAPTVAVPRPAPLVSQHDSGIGARLRQTRRAPGDNAYAERKRATLARCLATFVQRRLVGAHAAQRLQLGVEFNAEALGILNDAVEIGGLCFELLGE